MTQTTKIPVEHEDRATMQEFGNLVEDCVFCRSPTRYWHKATNKPVCLRCANIYKVGDLRRTA